MAKDPKHDQVNNGEDAAGGPDISEEQKNREFFGIEIDDPSSREKVEAKSFIPPGGDDDPAEIIYRNAGGGFFGTTIDTRGDNFQSEIDLIRKYRAISMHPEVDSAIQDITDAAIVHNDEEVPVTINLDALEDLDEDLKERFFSSFEHINSLLQFRKFGSDIFRRFYVDGKIVYHIVIDTKNPKKGIIDLRSMNPLQLQKVKEIETEKDTRTGIDFIKDVIEYYIYSQEEVQNTNIIARGGIMPGGTSMSGLKLAKDSVAYVTSGLTDVNKKISLSYLHKALRPVNQLRMMEDALIIYRITRAPERRIFNIDVGDMTPKMAEAYVRGIMSKYRNRITYDAETGKINSDRHHMHMMEDFFLPKTSTGKGTTIETLPGGQNLSEIDDIKYFQNKLYQSLNVPVSRLNPGQTPYTLGKTNEIDREEIRFQKFIDKLRTRFSELFKSLLKMDLILKGIINESEWNEYKEKLIVSYKRDNFFSELKEVEILKERIGMLQTLGFQPQDFFSREYIRKVILKQTDEEIEEIKKQMRSEHVSNDELFRKLEAGEAPGIDDFGGGGIDAAQGLGDFSPDEEDLEGVGAPGEEEFNVGEPTGAAIGIEDDELDLEDEEPIDLDSL